MASDATMRALYLGQKVELRPDHPLPVPAAGEALVRIVKAGICNTDLELVKGYLGFTGILGHELVGVLVALPENASSATAGETLPIGCRVVAEINCVPPTSRSRSAAERAQDATRTTLGIDRHDGAFAEYVSVPLINLHRVPGTVTDLQAVFVEPLAAACQILEQVHIRPTDRVCVLGDGKLGLLVAQVLATSTPCELLAIGRHARKLDILRQRGIRTFGPQDAVAEKSADVVVECTGSPDGFAHAQRLLRPRGTLVLKSTYAPPAAADPSAALAAWHIALTRVVIDEITVVGSRCGPFATALRLLEERRVDVLPLISAHYPLTDGLRALSHACSPGTLKVILDIAE